MLFSKHDIVKFVASLRIMHLLLIGENRLLDGLQMGLNLRMKVVGADHDAVGIVDGGLGQVDVIAFLEIFEVFGRHAWQFHHLVKARLEVLLEAVVIDGVNNFRLVEERVVADIHGTLDVDWHQSRNPAMAVDDVGRPIEFLHRFDDATGKEDTAIVVVVAKHAFFVIHQVLLLREEIVVVDEINLHPRLLDGGHFDNQRVVRIIDDEVHAREANHLVELVAAFVDDTVTRHEDSDFLTAFLCGLRKIATNEAHRRFRQIGCDFLMDE